MSEESSMLSLVPRTIPADIHALDVPHAEPFACDLRIDHQHSGDSVEHVSNIEYVRWLDRAAELHADQLGYTRTRMQANGMMWFVVRHEIDYLAEAWPGDHLLLLTWVRDMGRVKSWRDYLLVRPADEVVVCRAATLWVLVDLATRRPRRIPHEMAKRFQPLSMYRAGQRCTSR